MELEHSIRGTVSPSAGILPSSNNPSNVSNGIVPISAVCLTLSSISLALRMYTRVRLLKIFYREDYIIIAAWLFNTASTACCLEQEVVMNEEHLWGIPFNRFVLYRKWTEASMFLYIPASALPKVAILMSYIRVFPNKAIRIKVYAILFLTIGYVIAAFLALWLQCHPIDKSWNVNSPGQCFAVPQLLAIGTLNIAIEILVLLTPISTLVRWEVDLRTKILMGGVFATGSIACIVSVVRVFFVARLLHTSDFTRAISIPASLAVIETNLSVICGCLMVLRPFLRKHLPFLLETCPARARQTSSHSVDIEQPMIVLNTPVEFRCKTNTGFGGINSSAGWSWGHTSRVDTLRSVRGATADVKRGGDEGWPLRNDISPTVDHVMEGAYYPGSALKFAETIYDKEDFARGVQELDAYFESYGVIDTQARTADYVAAWSSWKVREAG